MSEFLRILDVSVAYGDIQALWGVSLDVNEGEIVALIGPNGAGKTTLMRAVAGLNPLKSGTIHLADKALHAMRAHRIVDQGVILVPEGRRLFGGLTVLDNLELGAYSKRARAVRGETLKLVYELFPLLADRKSQRANTMSGGQQQMLAIGRALMTNPSLLVLDEATEGLAPLVRAEIWRCQTCDGSDWDMIAGNGLGSSYSRGDGELIVHAVDRDGTMTGYDLDLLLEVTQAVSIPVVALGGAGSLADAATAIRVGGASAAAAGSMFVFQGAHRAVLISYPQAEDIRRAFAETIT